MCSKMKSVWLVKKYCRSALHEIVAMELASKKTIDIFATYICTLLCVCQAVVKMNLSYILGWTSSEAVWQDQFYKWYVEFFMKFTE